MAEVTSIWIRRRFIMRMERALFGWIACGAVGLCLLAGGCASYQALVEEAQVCEPGDVCVMAGGCECTTCPVPVRADAAQTVSEASKSVGGPCLDCEILENPRCVDGRCVADPATDWTVPESCTD